ncbi:MAG: ABC-type transport auxiliary lipoprotein family protein [Hyphomicrobiaceae bacterium]|nr:ABC-type transport auxiliary lipoprotein family protein [Hyphomicrobiaceae bacterium]
MEIRARYAQMGAFTLAVIAAGFAFVYWLNTASGLSQRDSYEVRFESPVSGLLRGSAVLFNGMRVGEVTALALDPNEPKRVTALIAIEAGTPVRADTAVGMDFLGLTGSPVVALVGGTSTAPLARTPGRIPVLAADPQSSQSMSQAARDVLRRFDTVLAENTEPLKSMIGNLDKFAAALGRNADRLDGIVAGVERMTGGGAAKTKIATFDLAVPEASGLAGKAPGVQLIVPDPSALSALDNERIQSVGADGAMAALADAQWTDALSKLVQVKLIRALEDASAFAGVSRPLEGFQSDFQLIIDIRKFQVSRSNGQMAEIEIAAKLSDGTGRIAAAQTFRSTAPIAGGAVADAARALDTAFGKAGKDLVVWTAATAAALTASPPAAAPGKKGKP